MSRFDYDPGSTVESARSMAALEANLRAPLIPISMLAGRYTEHVLFRKTVHSYLEVEDRYDYIPSMSLIVSIGGSMIIACPGCGRIIHTPAASFTISTPLFNARSESYLEFPRQSADVQYAIKEALEVELGKIGFSCDKGVGCPTEFRMSFGGAATGLTVEGGSTVYLCAYRNTDAENVRFKSTYSTVAAEPVDHRPVSRMQWLATRNRGGK